MPPSRPVSSTGPFCGPQTPPTMLKETMNSTPTLSVSLSYGAAHPPKGGHSPQDTARIPRGVHVPHSKALTLSLLVLTRFLVPLSNREGATTIMQRSKAEKTNRDENEILNIPDKHKRRQEWRRNKEAKKKVDEINSKTYAPLRSTQKDMFMAALFITADIWKQLNCTSIEEWIKRMQCIYTMEY